MSSENSEVSRVKVKFKIEGLGEAEGELIRHLAPRTAGAILRTLPVEGRAAIWKEEVYFEIPVKAGEEKAKAKVIFGKRGDRIVSFYMTQWRPIDGTYDPSAFEVFDQFVQSFKFLKKSFFETL